MCCPGAVWQNDITFSKAADVLLRRAAESFLVQVSATSAVISYTPLHNLSVPGRQGFGIIRSLR